MEGFVRAGTAQDTYAFLERYQPGLQAKVGEVLDAKLLEDLLNYPRTGWIPVEDDVAFVDALVTVLGFDGAVALVRASVAEHFDGALLATLVRGARRIFGMTPVGLIKMVPRAWPLVYKGFGRPKLLDHDDGHAVLEVDHAHPLAYTADGYLASWHGIFAGIADAAADVDPTSVKVSVEVDSEFPRFEIHTRWG